MQCVVRLVLTANLLDAFPNAAEVQVTLVMVTIASTLLCATIVNVEGQLTTETEEFVAAPLVNYEVSLLLIIRLATRVREKGRVEKKSRISGKIATTLKNLLACFFFFLSSSVWNGSFSLSKQFWLPGG